MKFTYTGSLPDELASGRPLAFGDVVDLSSAAQRANSRLIDEERLVRASTPAKPSTRSSK